MIIYGDEDETFTLEELKVLRDLVATQVHQGHLWRKANPSEVKKARLSAIYESILTKINLYRASIALQRMQDDG